MSFWRDFEVAAGDGDLTSRFYEAFHFDDNEASADSLAALVLAGTKRATASIVWSFEQEGKAPPKPGDLSVVTSWDGQPLCVIETTAVAIVAFDQVDEDFAATEGEGDASLAYWRRVHWDYFARECARIGLQPSLDMAVLCERFRVVYRRPSS